jgi:hypothetical protein
MVVEVYMEHRWKMTWTREQCKELDHPFAVGGRTLSI